MRRMEKHFIQWKAFSILPILPRSDLAYPVFPCCEVAMLPILFILLQEWVWTVVLFFDMGRTMSFLCVGCAG
jgi:hypothetical protein